MKKLIWLLAFLFLSSQINGVDFQTVIDGPLHEAYVVQERGGLLVDTIENKPHPPVKETITQQHDPESIWIPGYWSWSEKYSHFLWVSGVWRRPPPGHHWVHGYWKNQPDGWSWIRGYWARAEEEQPLYIKEPPPEPLDEKILAPPEGSDNYFWVHGEWIYEKQSGKYVWQAGTWEGFNPHWVYTPTHYIWRELGYVAVPGFWDWPMDRRGLPFYSIYVNPEVVQDFAYRPSNGLQELVVMQKLFPLWPNYSTLFRYHFFFHNDTWKAWGAAPSWWDWPSWWGFTWKDSLWLWWWWSHPGYPKPTWLDPKMAVALSPPPPLVIDLLSQTKAPLNVTLNGVVSTRTILQAIFDVTGKKTPILPHSRQKLELIKERIQPQRAEKSLLVPQGKENRGPVLKPFFGPADPNGEPPQKIVLPPIPPLTKFNPDTMSYLDNPLDLIAVLLPPRSYSKTESYDSPQEQQNIVPQRPQLYYHPSYRTPQTPRTELPTHTPEPRIQRPAPYAQPADRAYPQYRGTYRYHYIRPNVLYDHLYGGAQQWSHPSGVSPKFEYPYQGYEAPGSGPRANTPMMTEHHDYYMSNPHPQINPEGPNVHQLPEDYSTLPHQ